MSKKFLTTSESVAEGHPDKLADRISDSILDAIIAEDPNGRVAVETMVTKGMVFVAGEITTKCYVDIQKVVREAIKDVGYDDQSKGLDYKSCGVIASLQEQSPDIAKGVDQTDEHEQGAGDQGLMFGYATNETEEYMPMPIMLAHRITRRLAEVRKLGIIPYLNPDGKAQVTMEYEEAGTGRVIVRPIRCDTVIVAAHHQAGIPQETVKKDITQHVIKYCIPSKYWENTKVIVNGTGAFAIGGPQADCGLTGRKIIVDTYGGMAHHGGGAFSGKDPSKVDRSASYFARYIAKNIVAAGLAERCEVQIAYCIGVAQPVSVMVNTFGTSSLSNDELVAIIRKHFDMRPRAIIEKLKLLRPIYRKTSAGGHFGRSDPEFTWEYTDMPELKKYGG